MITTKDGIKINNKYKDRLFCLLFSDKANILSLYNALNNTHYNNTEDIEITTIEDAIYIKMKNDVSFLIDSYLSLWEQQSTFNPNMPIRGLMYFGNLYDAYIEKNELNIYGSKLIKIPTPKYIVFYNGTTERESIKELKLSDAFIQPDSSGKFEWTATMINLNKDKNLPLLNNCKILSEYMMLIETIRKYQGNKISIEDAVDMAIKECINNGILKEFLLKHRAEVLSMCISEYNEKVFISGIREEGREQGLEEGLEQGREQGREEERISAIQKMLKKNYSKEQILDLDYTEDEYFQAETELLQLV